MDNCLFTDSHFSQYLHSCKLMLGLFRDIFKCLSLRKLNTRNTESLNKNNLSGGATIWLLLLTLINVRGVYYPPLLKNCNFRAIQLTWDQSVNLSLLWSSVKRNNALYLSHFNLGGPKKFENILFPNSKMYISDSQGMSVKARDQICKI